MLKLSAPCASLLLLSLLLAGAFAGSARAQTRPTATTCDYFKKELSLAITKKKREDAAARAEAQKAQQAAQAQGAYAQPDELPAFPPARDYAGIERHRRAGEMSCARRSYEQGIIEYEKAFGLLGSPAPRR